MTPQERQLIDELFDRLATLENTRRDPEAERAIYDGFQRAPNAAYALVQSVLVQDEALKRANEHIKQQDDRIKELEAAGGGAAPAGGGGFLDTMRNAMRGHDEPRGSVPPVRPGGLGSSGAWSAPRPDAGPPPGQYPPQQPSAQPWGQPAGGQPGPQMAPQQAAPGFGGGSFLGTAASVAAGAVGGGLLLQGIRSMMGGSGLGGSQHSAFEGGGRSPFDSGAGNSDLARDAGVGDVGGSSNRAAFSSNDDNRSGATDTDYNNNDDDNDDDSDDDDSDYAGDFDDDDGGTESV